MQQLSQRVIDQFTEYHFVEALNCQQTKGCLIVKNPGPGLKLKVGVFDFEGFRGHILVPTLDIAIDYLEEILTPPIEPIILVNNQNSLFNKLSQITDWIMRYNQGPYRIA